MIKDNTLWDAIQQIERYVYVEHGKGKVNDDIFMIFQGLIDMLKKVAMVLESKQETNITILEDDGTPQKQSGHGND